MLLLIGNVEHRERYTARKRGKEANSGRVFAVRSGNREDICSTQTRTLGTQSSASAEKWHAFLIGEGGKTAQQASRSDLVIAIEKK